MKLNLNPNWHENLVKTSKKLKKPHFIRFFSQKTWNSLSFFHVVGGTLWKYFWQNSETIFVTKFFSRTRIELKISYFYLKIDQILIKIELKFIENQSKS